MFWQYCLAIKKDVVVAEFIPCH